MKVLAKRADRFIYCTPFILLIFIIMSALLIAEIKGYVRLGRNFFPGYLSFFIMSIIYVTGFCSVIRMPKDVIEYDDYGIYIYKRKNQEPILIRYEQIWSNTAEPDELTVYLRGPCYSYKSFKTNLPTGTLRIELRDEFVRVPFLADIKRVEGNLRNLVNENRRQFIEEMEQRIAEMNRAEELEELKKHDPST